MSTLYLEFFYRHSLTEMLLWGILLTSVWYRLASISSSRSKLQRVWTWLNRALLLAIILFILWRTLWTRGSTTRQICLTPFYTFVAARESPERYRSLVANILLFLPLGLSMPFSLPQKRSASWSPVVLTVCASLLLSIFVEAAQYYYALGLCETDDVIFNTFGAAFGTAAFWGLLHKK